MTKKKKTLRAKVLASIFAMLICGYSNSAWGSNYVPSTESGGAKSFTPHLILLDGWHTDVNGNTTLVGQGIINGMNSGTWFRDYGYYINGANYDYGYYISSDIPLSGNDVFDTIDDANFTSWGITEEEKGKIKKFAMSGGYVYGVQVGTDSDGDPKYAFNYNPYNTEEINGVTVPAARPDPKSWTPWDQVTFYSTYELIGREIAWESEYRVAADDLLHKDDISSITHDINTDGDKVSLVTTLTTYDKNTNSNKITSNSFDLTDAVNQVVNNRIETIEAGWTAQVSGTQSEQITAGETLNFAVEDSKGNLSVSMVGNENSKTIQFAFTATPEFDGLTVDSGNNTSIDIGKTEDGVIRVGTGNNGIVIDGSEGTISVGTGDNQVTINGTSGTASVGKIDINGNASDGSATITGLTNTTWDGINIVSGRAATEDQLQHLQQSIEGDITDINKNIDIIQDNYVTNIQENNKDDLIGHSWTVTQYINGSVTPEVVTIQDYNTTYTVNKDSEENLIGNQKNIYRVTNNYGSAVGEAIIDTDTEYTVTIENDNKSGNQVNIYRVQNSFDSFVGEAIIDTDTVTTMTEGNSNIHIENIGKNGGYNYKITLNKDLTNLDSVTSRIITATESVTTSTLILGKTNATTAITFDNTVNDGRITYVDANEEVQQVANLNDGKIFAGDSGNVFVKLKDGVNIIGGVTDAEQLTDNNIGVIAEQNNDGSATLNVKLSEDITGLNSVTSTTINSETVNVSKEININNKTKITENGMNINNKVFVEENNINIGGNTINNVAAGEISQNSTQAINGSQLYATNQRIEKLNGRVDKVGAGAAALAALHPLDFDPDDKLSFSAGVGNYGGETASALGMFYRPTEKVMFSAAGTMGNGENMVNMGVTFALDKTNNVSNSRVAMAREIQDLREQVAALTVLVTQLAGRSNPALQEVVMFPDVPENHWAYDYIEGLQKRGIVEGYPDGNFAGDRSMTRYEYAAMLYRALEKGFPVDTRLLDEFEAELGRIRIDRIKGLDEDANKVERVRVNQYEDRDDYGSKLITVNAVK